MASTGTPPNHALDGESRAATVYGIAIAFGTLTTIFVSLRLYTRGVILKSMGPDDWSMVVAQILSIFTMVWTCLGVVLFLFVNQLLLRLEARHGLGRHSWVVSKQDTQEQLKYLYCVILMYNLGMNVVKCSFLLQYRRILASETIRKICLYGIGFVIVWAIVQDLLLALSCVPISFIVPGMAEICLDTLPTWYASSSVSLITDFAIFALPLRTVWHLQLPRHQKYFVCGIFCLGFFVCIISIIRMFSLREAVNTEDPMWTNTEAAVWSVVELNTAIICSCLPTLRPLLSLIVPGLSSSHYTAKNAMKDYNSGGGSRHTGPTAKSVSTEELGLDRLGPSSGNGASATCSAQDHSYDRSQEDLELGDDSVPPMPRTAFPGGRNQILVTMETSVESAAKRNSRGL